MGWHAHVSPAVRIRLAIAASLLLALVLAQAAIQSQVAGLVTSPRQEFGASIGDDYFLVTYTQLERYWQKLDRESDRVTLVDIGRTEEGRTQWMAVVSAPDNLRALDRYREISRRLALGEGLNEAEARTLAAEGKAIVWIDGGLHANEVLGSQQLIETLYQLASGSDAETERILRDVIVLLVPANPDGQELVASWYMRQRDPRLRTLDGVPRAYQKYVGHDNNRDFYMATQAETINMNRVLYQEWFPQIVYDHHQTGPPGTVMFAPPFRDPFNYVFDPLIPASIDMVGAAMHGRFAAEGKPGVTMRSGSNYSTWWNGGLRTTAYFHNQIGLLTETIGEPTPIEIPLVLERQLPSADLPMPIAPQRWRFRQSIDYSLTANRAVLDLASRQRDTLLRNVYRMARHAIERGSRDTWTASPRRLEAVRSAPSLGLSSSRAWDQLHRPADRDPRGYVLPADQPDFPTAAKFVDALMKNGVAVLQAREPFAVGARRYPAGSFVVKTAQAFRPHVLDMFEPQDHPDDVPYDGAAPTPPYDSAGWTLAMLMGVKYDRILDGFDGPFEPVRRAAPPAGRVTPGAAGYLVSHHQNDAFIAVNRLLAAGASVEWPADRTLGGAGDGSGSMFVPADPRVRPILERASAALGLTVTGVAAPPAGPSRRLHPVRVGLWDRYGGASSSGWARWLLERFEFPFERVYAQAIDAGALASRFDVLVLPDEAVPSSSPHVPGEPLTEDVPAEYRATTGALTWDRSVPRLREFVEAGGTLVLIGRAGRMAEALGVPVSSALTRRASDGSLAPLSRAQFYVPGSVLRVAVDNTLPLAYGMEREADVFFDNSPVFRLDADAAARGVRRVAWFDSPRPLRSGWAWGQQYLNSGAAVVDAPVGQGRVLLFGPEILFRGQPHGTFKFLFNALLLSRAQEVAGAASRR